MRSYAPYDNISHAEYPPVYICGSQSDSRVSFSTILKYVKRLRAKAVQRKQEAICDQNIVLDIQEGGHFGQGNLESEAVIWAFLNKIIPPPGI
jgi:Protease II